MKQQVTATADGSYTLFVPELNEHYHSVNGAISESMHIFINAGLRAVPPETDPVVILEIGFGTGLNALLTAIEAEKTGRTIEYYTLEAFPLQKEIWSQLNYADILDSSMNPGRAEDIFHILHSSPWNEKIKVTSNFTLHKIHQNLDELMVSAGKQSLADNLSLIYFDAFGPDVQPEMWTVGVFSGLYEMMTPGGILVTYSVKGDVKRALRTAGFRIEKLPGPAGKREMLLAVR